MVAESSRKPAKGASRGSDVQFAIPETIQSVLAARIDRLPAVQKDVLQVASVIGKEVPAAVLSKLITLGPAELEETLTALSEAELLIIARAAPDREFSFKHALIQEVAYGSLLRERRRKLHALVCSTVERVYERRSSEYAELLAYHAWFGELWQEAVSYARQSGIKAIERSAYREAGVFFERALQALERLPATVANARLEIDLRLSLRIVLGAAGDYRRLYEHLNLAEARAAQIGDEARLGAVCTAKTHVLNVLGDIGQAISTGRRACALARKADDAGQSIASNYFLAQAHEFHGDYADAIAILQDDLPRLRHSFRHSRFGMTGTNSVLHLSLLSHSHGYLAQFAEAETWAREACLIAAETSRPFDAGIAHFGDGIVKICRGAVNEAIHTLEYGLQACESGEISGLFPMLASRLGFAYALAGRLQEGGALLDRACTESADAAHMHGWALAFSGWVEFQLGAASHGIAREFQALEVATEHSYSGMQVWILWFLGTMLSSQGADRIREAKELLTQAIGTAKRLGMRLHAAYCYGALAQACRRLDQSDAANAATGEAARIRHEVGAGDCLASSLFTGG
jgi:tetratricopeptide (TPR) repeat protein